MDNTYINPGSIISKIKNLEILYQVYSMYNFEYCSIAYIGVYLSFSSFYEYIVLLSPQVSYNIECVKFYTNHHYSKII